MQHIFTCNLLLLYLFGASGKYRYAYIKERKTWHEAQQYCQQEYAGLAPISNKQDILKMMKLVNRKYMPSWIRRQPSDKTEEHWMFWGGGRISVLLPAQDKPVQDKNSSSITNYFYMGLPKKAPFFCYKPVVVRKRKSWEEAWSYCKEKHNMLASVASVVEMKLIQKELSKFQTTKRVWIGLHFFPGDGWLWVDKQFLSYEIWGSKGKQQCPKVHMDCAALNVSRSDTSKTAGTTDGPAEPAKADFDGPDPNEPGTGSEFGMNNSDDSVWEDHNCGEKLNFICY